MVFVITCGTLSAAVCPIIASIPQPIPTIVILGLVLILLFMSCALPQRIDNLPKAAKISESIILLSGSFHQLQDSVLMPLNNYSFGWFETKHERELGSKRVRLCESQMDPDVHEENGNHYSIMSRKWDFSRDESSINFSKVGDYEPPRNWI